MEFVNAISDEFNELIEDWHKGIQVFLNVALVLLIIAFGVTFFVILWWVDGWIILHVLQGLSNVFDWGWHLPYTNTAYILVGIATNIVYNLFSRRN